MLAALLLTLDLIPGVDQAIAVHECAILAMIERDDGSSRRWCVSSRACSR